jgi:signal transduction histidine kinase
MNRLWVRLTIGFLLVTLVILAIVSYVIYAAVDSSFQRYVGARNVALLGSDVDQALRAYYLANGTWAGAEALLPAGMGRGMGGRGGHMGTFIADANGTIAAASDSAWIGRRVRDLDAGWATPIEANGAVIGLVGQVMHAGQGMALAEAQFTAQVSTALRWVAALAALLALAAGLLLSYMLARPLQRLAGRISTLPAAQLGQPLPVEGPTEVRELAAAFNDLSARVAGGELQRRQMATDIAHELRTPVTVLRGHLEAMMDGIYPLDGEHVAVAYDQTLHLARLVEDMRLLTQAEAGRLALKLTLASPGAVVEAAATRFTPLADDGGLRLRAEAAPDLPPILVDEGRIQQVLDNLLANALRHTTAGGEISIVARAAGQGVAFEIGNTGELPPEQVAQIFDRFWRGEDARQRDAGGSGLGLAISRQLVLLHHGRIGVNSVSGWTCFTIELPAAPQKTTQEAR